MTSIYWLITAYAIILILENRVALPLDALRMRLIKEALRIIIWTALALGQTVCL